MGWYDFDYGPPDGEEFDDHTLSDYSTPPNAIVLDGPVRAASRRGPIGTEWWGEQWVAAMERLGVTGRLERGKRYARNGSVLELELSHGMTFGHVQGSYGFAYRTAVYLQTFSDEEWRRALDALAGQAIYAAKLLAGEMPGDIETAFQDVGLSLFPRSLKDVAFECSCPDWGDPCKHAAALYYLIAEQLDADPFILLHLRGRAREQILADLRSRRSATVSDVDDPVATPQVPSLATDLDSFWTGSDARLIRAVPEQPVEPPLLRQFGDPPGGMTDVLTGLYQAITEEALGWLGLDDVEEG